MRREGREKKEKGIGWGRRGIRAKEKSRGSVDDVGSREGTNMSMWGGMTVYDQRDVECEGCGGGGGGEEGERREGR